MKKMVVEPERPPLSTKELITYVALCLTGLILAGYGLAKSIRGECDIGEWRHYDLDFMLLFTWMFRILLVYGIIVAVIVFVFRLRREENENNS